MMVLHNRAAAEDVFQDTAATMWEKFDQFKEGDNFAAWSIAIARNKAFEYLRKNKRSRMLFVDEYYLDIDRAASGASADFMARLTALDNCIGKLDPAQQQVLVLRYKKNLPVKEISQMLGGSSRLVYKRLVGIFDLLRVCIQRTLSQQEL